MGYEVKMYIVEPTNLGLDSNFISKDGKGLEVYSTEQGSLFHYGLDGNTKTFVEVDNNIFCKKFASVIAMIDLCKVTIPRSIKTPTDYYIYSDDGNTTLILDSYGDELTQVPLASMIHWLKRQLDEGSDYRRFKTALALSEGCVGLYNNPIVLLYGH
jgi:hypothetical protein